MYNIYMVENELSERKTLLLIRMVNELSLADMHYPIVKLLSSEKYNLIKEIFTHDNLRSDSLSIPEEKLIDYITSCLFTEKHREVIVFLLDKKEILHNLLRHSGYYKDKYISLINKINEQEKISKKVKSF
jgi:hypothetical protein